MVGSPRGHPGEGPALLVLDDDGEHVGLDAAEAEALLAFTEGLEPATVSACPTCRSRVVAVVAFSDLLTGAPPHPRTGALLDLADEAPTLHLYVVDRAADCEHSEWRDPGYDEWADVVDETEVELPGAIR
jgi:hypothetical protein